MASLKIGRWQWGNVDLFVQLVHGEGSYLSAFNDHQVPALRACLLLVHKVLDCLGQTQASALDF